MSGEHAGELSGDLRDWVDRRAEETDRDPEDVLSRAVSTYRALEEQDDRLANGGEAVMDPSAASSLRERLDELERRISELEGREGRIDDVDIDLEADTLERLDERVGDLEAAFDEKIEDVRKRVIQVKQEADAKASADHRHEDLRQQVQQAHRAAEEATTASADLEDEIERVDRGFENFEEVLEYLTDTTEELEEKLDAVARIVIELRRSVGELEGTASARAAAADLQTEANREGVSTAKCEGCGSKVQLGLLSTPHCPHCETTFREVEPGGRLFGSATLRTGDQPALETGESDSLDSPEDIFEEYDTGGDRS